MRTKVRELVTREGGSRWHDARMSRTSDRMPKPEPQVESSAENGPDDAGAALTSRERETVKRTVERAFDQYGEALRQLSKE